MRTSAVGHLRDVRRLIVAMSRAKLGLYIFGRWATFEGCLELQPVWKFFRKRPLSLALQKDFEKTEFWPVERYETFGSAYSCSRNLDN